MITDTWIRLEAHWEERARGVGLGPSSDRVVKYRDGGCAETCREGE